MWHNGQHLAWAVANKFWVNVADNDHPKAKNGRKKVRVINSPPVLSPHCGVWLLHIPEFWKKKQNRKQNKLLPLAYLYQFKTAFSSISQRSRGFIRSITPPPFCRFSRGIVGRKLETHASSPSSLETNRFKVKPSLISGFNKPNLVWYSTFLSTIGFGLLILGLGFLHPCDFIVLFPSGLYLFWY